MTIMTSLVERIRVGDINFNMDLPYPNIYWGTVVHSTAGTYNVYIAAQYTGAAKQKVENWCSEVHGFRPYRSNSELRLRRLKLGDIVQHPEAFDAARKFSLDRGESDIVAALDKLPAWIAEKVGVPMPVDVEAAETLWNRLVGAVEQYSVRKQG